MFTGIIEQLGRVIACERAGTNITFQIATCLDEPIKVDQSIAHSGVCLTVTEVLQNDPHVATEYKVVAVDETLQKTNLGTWQPGTVVNIERCLKAGQRMDGHFVQGHVDTTGTVTAVRDVDGSWMYEFAFAPQHSNLLVDKGSICVNGVSLTVVASGEGSFSVTIIPYTHAHTNFHALQVGDKVNLEFDILGKYLHKIYGRKP